MAQSSPILKRLYRILTLLIKPIKEEWAFFVMFFLLISVSLFKILAASLVSLSIDSVVFDSLCRGLAIAYILTAAIYASRSKLLKLLFYLIGITLFAVNIFLWLVFHMVISTEIATYLAETNGSEASQFASAFIISGKGIMVIIVVILALLCVIGLEKVRLRITDRERFSPWGSVIIDCLLLLLVVKGLFAFELYYRLTKAKALDEFPVQDPNPYDSVTACYISFAGLNVTRTSIEHAITLTGQVKGGTFEDQDSLYTVLIIGESYIKRHAGVYGYALPTTPNLSREEQAGNLFVFRNVVTPYPDTSKSIRNILSLNSLLDGEVWNESPFIPAIFKKSGASVYLWDNQRDDFTKAAVASFAMQSFLYNDKVMANSYTATNDSSYKYDDDIVKNFEHRTIKPSRNNLVIFHFWGQHIGAADRYPHTKQFERFTIKDEKRQEAYLDNAKKQDIADYDNATYYNDYVVGHIINLFRDKNAVVLYLSDHGEEIYDYRDSKGRKAPDKGHLKEWLNYVIEIPFMVWCSDRYKEKHPQIIQDITAALNRPFMTDNICQLLFHLSFLNTSYYNAQRDLLSPHFQVKDRIVNDKINYDKAIPRNQK